MSLRNICTYVPLNLQIADTKLAARACEKLCSCESRLQSESAERYIRALTGIVVVLILMLMMSACVPPQPQPIVYTGSYTIRNQNDIDYLQDFTEITGTLYIDKDATVSHVQLPNLWKLGKLHVHYNASTHGNTQGQLVAMSFASLETINGEMNIVDNDKLYSISFPILRTINGAVTIGSNNMLQAISFPKLYHAKQLYFSSNLAVSSISFPNLNDIDNDIDIDDINSTNVAFPALTTVGGNLRYSGSSQLTSLKFFSLLSVGKYLGVAQTNKLADVSFPVLLSVGGEISINYNHALKTLFAPVLVTASSLRVTHNSLLPTCQVDAINPLIPRSMVCGTKSDACGARVCGPPGP